jgi:hypothetical protein
MNKADLIELIYAERATIAEEQERAEGSDLALLEGWEKALSWVIRKITQEGEGDIDPREALFNRYLMEEDGE